jgi:hypothetical protein
MRRPFGVLLALAILTISCGSNGSSAVAPGTSMTPTVSSSPVPDSPYLLGFRWAYLPIVTTLNDVTAACARSDMRVELLPACGRRVAALQLAIRDLARYVRTTAPPDRAAAAARGVATSLHGMHAAFDTLAGRIEREDLDGVLAMGGMGGPIDTPIQAFVTAVGTVDDTFPGEALPLPG